MNNTISIVLIIGVIIGAAILAGWGLAAILRRYLEVSTGKAVVILLLSLVAGVGAWLIRLQQPETSTPMCDWSSSHDVEALAAVFAGLLTVLVVVFLVRLHSKWIAGRLTDAEKKTGLDGARAWLGVGNIVCVILISLLAWLVFDYSLCGVALLGLLALLAYPVMNSASISFQAPPPESNAAERQRVLSMLDSGKITASECAELLNALNFSEKPRAAKDAGAPPRMLALIGALVLLIGFFLPWFRINPQVEVNRLAQGFHIDPNWLQHSPLGHLNNMVTTTLSGGDIDHGLGWLVLFLGVAAAALPYLAANLPEQTRQRATLAGLGAGAIILLYLVTQNLRFVSVGILMAVIGYGLQLAGALQGGRNTIGVK
jgi:hypothetical protein